MDAEISSQSRASSTPAGPASVVPPAQERVELWVQGEGAWALTVQDLRPQPLETAHDGTGNAVLQYTGDSLSARFVHRGDGVFTVTVHTDDGADSAIIESGDVDRRLSWDESSGVLFEIEATGEGAWTVAVDQLAAAPAPTAGSTEEGTAPRRRRRSPARSTRSSRSGSPCSTSRPARRCGSSRPSPRRPPGCAARARSWTWTAATGLADPAGTIQAGTTQPARALEHAVGVQENAVFVFYDLHAWFGTEHRPADPAVVRKVRETALEFRHGEASRALIVTSPVRAIPPELDKLVHLLDFPCPPATSCATCCAP